MQHRSARELEVWRALTHPLWWVSLVVLAVNDHLLKGADLLPAWFTGKLSDFAGLLVAPALLAVLLRVRTRRGWWLAHALVGAVFAAIQLSTAAAASWSGAMSAVGVPWAIWSDPTDLIALPMLLVSGRALAMDAASAPTASIWRRGLAWSGLALGAGFCMATSPLPPPHTLVQGQPDLIQADVYLYNQTGSMMSVDISMPSDHFDIDCVRGLDAADNMRPDMYRRDGVWNQSLGEVATVWPIQARSDHARERGCFAVRFRVEGAEPVIAFWRAEDIPVVGVPKIPTDDALTAGAIVVTQQSDGTVDLCTKGPVQLVRAHK